MSSACLPLLLLTVALSACQSSSSTKDQATSGSQPGSLSATVPKKEASPDQATVVTNDFLIIPGERVGPIKPTTSEADLLKLVGPSVVTAADTIYGAEGAELIGTTLYKGTSDEVQISYTDAKRTKPKPFLSDPNYLTTKAFLLKAYRLPAGQRLMDYALARR